MALNFFRKIKSPHSDKWFIIGIVVVSLALIAAVGYNVYQYMQNQILLSEKAKSMATIVEINNELSNIKSQDPYKTNTELKKQIDLVQNTFKDSVVNYEALLDLENPPKDIKGLDGVYATVLTQLGKSDYAGATKTLAVLSIQITAEQAKLAADAAATVAKNIPVTNNAPSSGSFSRQVVASDVGSFQVDIIAGDLSTTRVIVDTASDSTCANNCPVLPLATYVARSGAYAGVNGSYFCPTSYPDCAGKTNSFDLLVMNKNKTYFNSDNNVYSTNPAVVFGGSYIKFVSAAQQLGRDTNIDGILSNFPLLVSGGNISFGGNNDPKQSSKSNRSFVANKGNVAYIGVVHNATEVDVAHVLKTMGMENALNLDDGGSAALWSGGYKVGPGRDIPNVILFVKK